MTDRELTLFARGEFRTDGWKSQWRIDFERRMAEEEAARELEAAKAPKPIFRAVPRIPPVQPIVKKYIRTSETAQERRERLKAIGKCRDCGVNPLDGNHTACRGCLDKRKERSKQKTLDKRRQGRAKGAAPRFCSNHPDVRLNITNKSGICKPCFRQVRYQLSKLKEAA